MDIRRLPKVPEFKAGLFAGIPDERLRSEASSVATLLAFLDSIHDFWPERGTKSVSDEDTDEPEELDERRLDAVHEQLVASIRSYLGATPALSIEQVLSQVTNGNVTSVHGVEDKTLAFFKRSFKPFNGQEIMITVPDLLARWKFADYGSWERYSAAVAQLPNSIDIEGGGRSIKSLTDTERGHVGFFMLAYLNPSVNPGVGSVGLTFDMSPRDVGKIFNTFKQVYNAIYPQNISDSASTSFSALLGRSKFHNVNGIFAITPGARQEAQTNAFTFGKYRIFFVDKGFGPKNKFAFSIVVTDMSGKELGKIPFGPRNEQGPSVNYLMDIISSKDPRSLKTAVPKIATVAKLSDLTVYDKDLLFDLKRLGDQEQMIVAGPGVYTVTGDRFAHAFRRLINRSGIYHSVKGFRISRFGGLTAEQAEQQSAMFRLTGTFEKLKVVVSFSAQYATAGSDLNKVRNHVLFGIQKGYVFSEPIDISGLLSPGFIDTNYTKIGSTFATLLARYRMIDIFQHIEKLRTTLGTVLSQQSRMQQAYDIIKSAVDANAYNESTRGELDYAEEFLGRIEELRNMNVSFDASNAPIPLYTQLFDASGRMIKGVSNTFFNFSTGPFTHPESGLASVVSKLLVNRKARRPEAVKDAINKLLVQYFISRDLVKEAFFNQDFLSYIERVTDISNGLPPAQVVGSMPAAPGQQGILEVLANTYTGIVQLFATYFPPYFRLADPPAARGGVQIGAGPGQVLQYRDIHELFVEICNDASVASESGDTVLHALDDIEVKWVNGIDELRQQALDDYGEPFQESVTTDILSFILSFRTTQDRNGQLQSEPGVTFRIQDNTIFPTVEGSINSVATGRTTTVVNDIGGILLRQVPVEPAVLGFLIALNDAFQTNPIAFSAPDEWKSFWTQFYAHFRIPLAQPAPPRARRSEAERLQLWRGGRRPLYSEAAVGNTIVRDSSGSRSKSAKNSKPKKQSRTRRNRKSKRKTR